MDANRKAVARAVELRQGRITKLRDEITQWQRVCEHPAAVRIPRSMSGYSELTEYWYDCHCPDCNKHWTEAQ